MRWPGAGIFCESTDKVETVRATGVPMAQRSAPLAELFSPEARDNKLKVAPSTGPGMADSWPFSRARGVISLSAL